MSPKPALAIGILICVAACSGTTPKSDTVAALVEQARPDPAGIEFFRRPKTLAKVRASANPGPLLILLQTDPGLMVIGSDSPKVALYEDGTLIYVRNNQYNSTTLTPVQIKTLLKRLEVGSLLSGRYNAAPGWTDQPDNNLLIYAGERPRLISIYGNLQSANVRARLPSKLAQAFKSLSELSDPVAKPWLPKYIEVMLSPYRYAPDRSIVWPKHWADLHSSQAKRRGVDAYSIFLPSSELAELQRFLGSRKERAAVEIGGDKWSAHIRMPFLHEELWMMPKTD